jgi:hypothetical protein
MNNPIIEEIREARAALAEEHGYDLVRLNEWAQRQTEARRQQATQPKPNQVLAPAAGAAVSPMTSETTSCHPDQTLAPAPAVGTA